MVSRSSRSALPSGVFRSSNSDNTRIGTRVLLRSWARATRNIRVIFHGQEASSVPETVFEVPVLGAPWRAVGMVGVLPRLRLVPLHLVNSDFHPAGAPVPHPPLAHHHAAAVGEP